MQKIRGFVYFESKSLEEVKESFSDFNLDSLTFAFFKSLRRHGENISHPGVFIDGKVDDKYSSEDVIALLMKQVGPEEKTASFDVSIESEDNMETVKEGELKGNYIGIRITPPYVLEQIKELSSQIGEMLNASNVLYRTVEAEKTAPLVCIDLITSEGYEKHKEEIEQLIGDYELTLKSYTFIELE